MKILAFETSAKAASVALLEDGKLLGECYQNTGLTHSQTLLVMAQSLLDQCGKTVEDVTAAAVAAGPGSFTGVRIGVAAAKGFAWGRKIPCYGVSTLEATALSFGGYQGYVCPCMDARRSQVYNALFYVNHGKGSPASAVTVRNLTLHNIHSGSLADRDFTFVNRVTGAAGDYVLDVLNYRFTTDHGDEALYTAFASKGKGIRLTLKGEAR